MLDLFDLLDFLIRGLKPPIGKHWGWWLLWLPLAAFCTASIALMVWIVVMGFGVLD